MASLVFRNGFSFCSGCFYVELESDPHIRHERESASRLYDLLTYVTPGPVLTKAGKVAKRQPPPHKDPTVHFYRAQLLHYGLPDVKTKAAAENRLLGAFIRGPNGEKILSVPSAILELEKEMKTDWTKSVNAAEEKRERKRVAEKVRQAERARTLVEETARFYQRGLFMDESEEDEDDKEDDEESEREEEDDTNDSAAASANITQQPNGEAVASPSKGTEPTLHKLVKRRVLKLMVNLLQINGRRPLCQRYLTSLAAVS